MKYALAVLVLIIGIQATLPEDCYSDNGKRFDNCTIVNGKTIFTKE